MDDKFEIQNLSKDELEDASNFHQRYYDDKRPLKVWLWEYQSIYPDKSVLVGIKNESELIATQGMVPIYLNINGKRCLSGKSESTLVDKKYRGKGLFADIYNSAIKQSKDKGMCCLWGFTKALVPFQKVGYRTYEGAIKCAILPLDHQTTKRAAKLASKNKIKSGVFSFGIRMGRFYSSLRMKSKQIKNANHQQNSIYRLI
jgi:GNAT superfamily N-acetyltransferase